MRMLFTKRVDIDHPGKFYYFTIEFKIFTFLIMRLNPWFVTGYTDAEGSFIISIIRSKTHFLGWQVRLIFEISAENNPANLRFLELLLEFFGGVKFIRVVLNYIFVFLSYNFIKSKRSFSTFFFAIHQIYSFSVVESSS
jgi:hypothetical protein